MVIGGRSDGHDRRHRLRGRRSDLRSSASTDLKSWPTGARSRSCAHARGRDRHRPDRCLVRVAAAQMDGMSGDRHQGRWRRFTRDTRLWICPSHRSAGPGAAAQRGFDRVRHAGVDRRLLSRRPGASAQLHRSQQRPDDRMRRQRRAVGARVPRARTMTVKAGVARGRPTV